MMHTNMRTVVVIKHVKEKIQEDHNHNIRRRHRWWMPTRIWIQEMPPIITPATIERNTLSKITARSTLMIEEIRGYMQKTWWDHVTTNGRVKKNNSSGDQVIWETVMTTDSTTKEEHRHMEHAMDVGQVDPATNPVKNATRVNTCL